MSPARAYAEVRGTGLRPMLRRALRVWWTALSSGRFFTGWSAVVSLVLALTVLGAYVGVSSVADYLPALGVSVLGWLLLVALFLPVGWGERRLHSPRARGRLVVASLVIGSAVRPFVNDGIMWLMDPGFTCGTSWLQRIATNLLVWTLMLSLVAVATVGYGSVQSIGRRLQTARAALAAADRRAAVYEREAHAALHDGVARIRARLIRLAAGRPGFDDVREFSEVVRGVSHRLQDTAAVDVAAIGGSMPPQEAVRPAARSFRSRLRPPPRMSVAVFFLVGSLPYMLSVAPWYLVLLAVVLVLAIGAAADAASRRWTSRRSAETRGTVVIGVWVAAGVLLSLVAAGLHPASGPIALFPILALPGIAIVAGMCTDAVRRSIVQARRLSRALAEEVSALSARTARTRAALRTAADRLHGYVQGRCVVFAAALEDRSATADETRTFVESIDRALDGMLRGAEERARDADALADLLASWANVLRISSDIDPAARAALADDAVSRQVAAIATEGFVNAVKHSGARSAELSVHPGGEPGQALRVQVAAPGQLRTGLGRRGRGLAQLGARLYQRGEDVVLEAIVPEVHRSVDAASASGV